MIPKETLTMFQRQKEYCKDLASSRHVAAASKVCVHRVDALAENHPPEDKQPT